MRRKVSRGISGSMRPDYLITTPLPHGLPNPCNFAELSKTNMYKRIWRSHRVERRIYIELETTSVWGGRDGVSRRERANDYEGRNQHSSTYRPWQNLHSDILVSICIRLIHSFLPRVYPKLSPPTHLCRPYFGVPRKTSPRQERRRKNVWGNDVVGDRSSCVSKKLFYHQK